mmetsp:Transcript_15917/g.17898  ORF Transcript_15917/g.17898 Transcript_15917/m.17898 type:complete len:94 (+) Transcript_15917:130-411(+)
MFVSVPMDDHDCYELIITLSVSTNDIETLLLSIGIDPYLFCAPVCVCLCGLMEEHGIASLDVCFSTDVGLRYSISLEMFVSVPVFLSTSYLVS